MSCNRKLGIHLDGNGVNQACGLLPSCSWICPESETRRVIVGSPPPSVSTCGYPCDFLGAGANHRVKGKYTDERTQESNKNR
jgi:hypothetical protein